METIITYDISGKHVDFKNEMKRLGYQDRIKTDGNCKIIYLPNTTLYHPTKTPMSARDEAQLICDRLNVMFERCFATTWNRNHWGAICGDPF
jgi:hypothetical protein